MPSSTWVCMLIRGILLTAWSRVLIEKLPGFAANQDIPRFLRNPKVHTRYIYIHTHARAHTHTCTHTHIDSVNQQTGTQRYPYMLWVLSIYTLVLRCQICAVENQSQVRLGQVRLTKLIVTPNPQKFLRHHTVT